MDIFIIARDSLDELSFGLVTEEKIYCTAQQWVIASYSLQPIHKENFILNNFPFVLLI